jgi:hypothetical protein
MAAEPPRGVNGPDPGPFLRRLNLLGLISTTAPEGFNRRQRGQSNFVAQS